jgi:hypothetical protein
VQILQDGMILKEKPELYYEEKNDALEKKRCFHQF